MGLDMYLYIDEYVSRSNPKTDEENQAFNTIASVINSSKHIQPQAWQGFSIKVPVAYWRKANAIHGWIIEHCANGVDECQEIGMNRNELQDLLNTCKKVLTNSEYANELLPRQPGYFFGSLEVDEWYQEDLKYTIGILDKLLDDPDVTYVIYQASW
jgi:hypothetical protein